MGKKKMSINWIEECKVLVNCIVRDGFEIETMGPGRCIKMGREYGLRVVLAITTGTYRIFNLQDWEPGICEGLIDMARDGLEGKMILYGVAFHFVRV